MKHYFWVVLALTCCNLGYAAADKTTQVKANQEKESYIQKANQEVQEWSNKIKALQERSENSGVKTRQDLDQRLKGVDETLATARKKLEELQNSGENAWKNLRDGLDKALADLQHHYQKAESTLNKDKKKEKS